MLQYKLQCVAVCCSIAVFFSVIAVLLQGALTWLRRVHLCVAILVAVCCIVVAVLLQCVAVLLQCCCSAITGDTDMAPSRPPVCWMLVEVSLQCCCSVLQCY